MIPAESARHRMTGPLLGTPIAPQIKGMDPGAHELMVNEMLAPWTHTDGSLHGPTEANVIIATK